MQIAISVAMKTPLGARPHRPAFENCSFELVGRLLESVSNYRSRWMVISLAIARQNPAYRATLLNHKWAGAKSPLTFLYFVCTSYCRTCRKLRVFYGANKGTYGQSHGQFYPTDQSKSINLLVVLSHGYSHSS